MKMTKRFTEKYIATDCEARDWTWKATEETYEELVHELKATWNAWFDAVRVVDRVFDSDTFEITVHPVKVTRRTYKNYSWDGGVKEEVL